jgi:hypothetical protein
MPQSRPATTPRRKNNPVARIRRTSFRNGKSQNASTIEVLYTEGAIANGCDRLRWCIRAMSRDLPGTVADEASRSLSMITSKAVRCSRVLAASCLVSSDDSRASPGRDSSSSLILPEFFRGRAEPAPITESAPVSIVWRAPTPPRSRRRRSGRVLSSYSARDVLVRSRSGEQDGA